MYMYMPLIKDCGGIKTDNLLPVLNPLKITMFTRYVYQYLRILWEIYNTCNGYAV